MTTKIDMEKLEKICPTLSEAVKNPSSLRWGRSSQQSVDSIARRMLALAEFAEYCLDQCSWDNEPDGGSIQDKAEELGFLELRPIDPEDSIDGETEHYFCKWTPQTTPHRSRR